MGFSLKGFAGGLADSATDYYKDQNDSRDTKKKDTRNLIFKAHEQVYSDAKEAQKVNQAQIKLDTAYISGVESMDPTISDDNKSKLLSLTPEKRQQAEDELLYRQVADPSATFSSFMSYVEEPEDLDDMERVDQRATDSLIAVPNPAEPYYDKTGLVADSTIDTMYSKVAGVLTDAHGFSPEKAREIIKQAAQEVEYPPIAIDWSERAFLKQASTERIIEENALIITKNDAALAGLTKTNIDLAADATSGAIDLFASNYMRQTMDEDGDLEWLDAGKTKPKLVQVPMQQAKDDPEFTNRFRKSKAYKQLALDSASSYIMDMVTNPKKKRNSMAYLNGAFPGMYKGEIDVSTAEGIEKAKGVDVNKIYFLKANPNNTSTPQGGVYMGSQILAGLKQQGLITGDTDVVNDTTDTSKALVVEAANVIEAKSDVTDAKEKLAFAIEIDETEENIELLTTNIADMEAEVERQERKARYELSRENRVRKEEDNTFNPDSQGVRAWHKNLQAAIQAGDKGQVQQVLDWLEEHPQDREGKYSSNLNKYSSMKGDALRAMNTEGLFGDARKESFDERTAPLEDLRSRALLARKAGASSDEIKALIKDINEYVKTTTNDEQLMELDGLKSGLISIL